MKISRILLKRFRLGNSYDKLTVGNFQEECLKYIQEESSKDVEVTDFYG